MNVAVGFIVRNDSLVSAGTDRALIQHVVLTEDDVLARCGVWHVSEFEECAVKDNWVIVRVPK